MNKINIFLADGFEEVEAIAVIDILRRARLDIDVVSIMPTTMVVSSHKIKVTADKLLDEVKFDEGDMIILPGGLAGTNRLGDCDKLVKQIVKYNSEGKMLAAICAGPSVLGDNGILNGKEATCYPGFEDRLKGAKVVFDKVAVSENTITSRGMGTAIEFGLAIVTHYVGREKADEIAKQIIYM